uniref:Ubiquitin-fold modifier-conjugating enzyme 1 n=1 Tax=Lotharella globosa TaxID=91324 RepID=A0A7S4DDW8_9EUKA|mmetsp:Transcript_12733/g.25990  ORF Transcript_12733/g.25990 Transcript_12733/m.25990 type:complete len:176 (-) Transcript_12733:163-690(-)
MLSQKTKETVSKIPLCATRAGPRDKEKWVARLKEELKALITYVNNNKKNDNDWFFISPNADGTQWSGKCWTYHEMHKYEFNVNFEIPITYPVTPFEIVLPELDGKTVKMYRGGKICLSAHFKPLWSKNVPRFGVAHALALGLAPWLAAEIPSLVDAGLITAKSDQKTNDKPEGSK